jgi:hypothetical protein
MGDMIDQRGQFLLAPYLRCRAGEGLRLGNGDRPVLHAPSVRQ